MRIVEICVYIKNKNIKLDENMKNQQILLKYKKIKKMAFSELSS